MKKKLKTKKSDIFIFFHVVEENQSFFQLRESFFCSCYLLFSFEDGDKFSGMPFIVVVVVVVVVVVGSFLSGLGLAEDGH